jgi:cytidine deaminase
MMTNIELKISIQEYDKIEEIAPELQTICERAKENVMRAYNPYSNFHVGAAILLENGVIVDGSNQENAAYPSGLCAERVAMFYANSMYPDVKPVAIAVTAFYQGRFIARAVPPCGSCRQVLMESESRYKSDIKILLVGSEKIQVMNDIKSLLPLNFDSKYLNAGSESKVGN